MIYELMMSLKCSFDAWLWNASFGSGWYLVEMLYFDWHVWNMYGMWNGIIEVEKLKW